MCFITLVVDVLCYIHYGGCRCVLLHSLHLVDVLCYIHYIGCRCVFYIHYIACRWHPRVLWRGLGSHIHHTTLQSLASKYTIMIDNVISTSKSVVVYIKTVLKEFIR